MDAASELEQGFVRQIRDLRRLRELEEAKARYVAEDALESLEAAQRETNGLLLRVVETEKRSRELAAAVTEQGPAAVTPRLRELEATVRTLSAELAGVSKETERRLREAMVSVTRDIAKAGTGKAAMAGYKKGLDAPGAGNPRKRET